MLGCSINIQPLRGWLSAISISGVGEASANVIFGEFRIIADDFLVSHSGR
jgi:hypothetical protein